MSLISSLYSIELHWRKGKYHVNDVIKESLWPLKQLCHFLPSSTFSSLCSSVIPSLPLTSSLLLARPLKTYVLAAVTHPCVMSPYTFYNTEIPRCAVCHVALGRVDSHLSLRTSHGGWSVCSSHTMYVAFTSWKRSFNISYNVLHWKTTAKCGWWQCGWTLWPLQPMLCSDRTGQSDLLLFSSLLSLRLTLTTSETEHSPF